MITIGFTTIGESPRDDIVPGMMDIFGTGATAAQRGCLDGLTRAEIDALAPEAGEVGIVTLLKSGDSVLLSHSKILPIMQTKVDELIRDEHAELVVILCGADWTAIKSDRLVINPGKVFPGIVSSLAAGRKLGVIKPSAGQVEQERNRYTALGIEAVVTSASPYAGEARLGLARTAAEELKAANCDLIWMTCVGMDKAMRDEVAEITGKPVILAQSVLARVVSELLPQGSPVASHV
jgi:protein AroM